MSTTMTRPAKPQTDIAELRRRLEGVQSDMDDTRRHMNVLSREHDTLLLAIVDAELAAEPACA